MSDKFFIFWNIDYKNKEKEKRPLEIVQWINKNNVLNVLFNI
jgi:hypothetical protein